MSTTVDQPSNAVAALRARWALTEALVGGTEAMRAASTTYLPKWPGEETDDYAVRLAQAVLYPAFSRTVRVMSGKPFAKQITLSEGTPELMSTWCADVDRQGVSLHVFAAEMFEEVMAHGLAGILVDTPRGPDTGSRTPTQADQQRVGMRPYFVRVMHRQILGWRAVQSSTGMRLTMLRLMECVEEPDGEFGTVEVEQVRVLELGKWTTYRKGAKSWAQHDTGTTGVDFIPYVPLYGIRKSFMVGLPPLMDLAYQNVYHWQSSSDQQNILHVARVPILTIAGVDKPPDLKVGGQQGVYLGSNPDAKIAYVEHTGKAIQSGRESLLDLEERMVATGAELMVVKPGGRTATEDSNDAEGNKSDLQRIAEGFEDSLDLALSYMARLGGQTEGTTVTLFKDYAAATLSDASAQLILSMQQSGLITKITALKEQQRRGVLSADIDPQDEADLAADEVVPPDDDDDTNPGDPADD